VRTIATYFIGACPNCGSNTIKGLYPGSPILAEDNETIIESKFAIVTCMDCEFEIRAKSMDEIISVWNREYDGD
jgi:hypothetical protein